MNLDRVHDIYIMTDSLEKEISQKSWGIIIVMQYLITENDVMNSSLSTRQISSRRWLASEEGLLPGSRKSLEKET